MWSLVYRSAPQDLSRARPPDVIRWWTAQVVCVLEHLHAEYGVAYRDLKPENLVVGPAGCVAAAPPPATWCAPSPYLSGRLTRVPHYYYYYYYHC